MGPDVHGNSCRRTGRRSIEVAWTPNDMVGTASTLWDYLLYHDATWPVTSGGRSHG